MKRLVTTNRVSLSISIMIDLNLCFGKINHEERMRITAMEVLCEYQIFNQSFK